MPRTPDVNPRSRMVNFRLTQQEYEEVRAACAGRGGHSLSEFARAALLEFSKAQTLLDASVQNQLTHLDQKLSRILQRLE